MLIACTAGVLLACVLGRLIIVPLSQAGNYEVNGREYNNRLAKNELLVREVMN